MGTYWTLHVVPTTPAFAPSGDQVVKLMDYLAKETGVAGGFEIGKKTDLDAKGASKAIAAAKGDVECAVPFTDDLKSGVLFNWDPDEGDDEFFWADGLRITISAKPRKFVDLESPKIPGRSARFSIAFTGNKGWVGDSANAKAAFKHKTFLPGLEKLLGVPLAVVAISS